MDFIFSLWAFLIIAFVFYYAYECFTNAEGVAEFVLALAVFVMGCAGLWCTLREFNILI